MKFFTKIITAIITGTVGFITLIISVPFINNLTAKRIMQDLLNTPLPQSTEISDSISIAGKISGSGNGMQFLGALLIIEPAFNRGT